ncbi:MAG TPA: metallophosphoesterase family protein [Armatimonadota bacterium]|nr:metallophosphoesterase family protein [Armatimonadota bacterium]
MPPTLQFRDDGTFIIAQFTDIHWQNGGAEDRRSRALMERVLDEERPDLVVLTGDVIAGSGCENPAESWRQAVAPVLDRGTPWAAVFGNHDDEGSLGRSELMASQWSLPHCLSEPGPADIPGIGNFILEIGDPREGRTAALLYFLDSGSYDGSGAGTYAWIAFEQVEWYRRESSRLNALHGKDGPLPALAFFHIPLPEYNDAWDRGQRQGSRYENVCCPALNTGLFTAFYEQSDVSGVFVGHDHVNDFEGTLHGIRLCYGRASGYNTYGRDGFPRGVRMIRLDEGQREFTTWMNLDGQAEPISAESRANVDA